MGTPVSDNLAVICDLRASQSIRLSSYDPDNTVMAYAVVAAPTKGTISNLSAATGTLVYTPSGPQTSGTTDTFTYRTTNAGGTNSNTATVTITFQSKKTRVRDQLVGKSGGKVTFILTQKVTSVDGLLPVGSSVSANVDANGWFTADLYPTANLSPTCYYQVWYTPTAGAVNQSNIGVYSIPSTTAVITLASYAITDANIAAQYLFPSKTAIDSILTQLEITAGGGGITAPQKTASQLAALTPGSSGQLYYQTDALKGYKRDYGSAVGIRQAAPYYHAYELGFLPEASDSTTRTANSAAWAAMMTALPARGARIAFPEGRFYFAEDLEVTKLVTIEGAGTGFAVQEVGTRIYVESGQSGFSFISGSAGSTIKNLSVMTRSGYSGQTAGDGLYCLATVKIDNVFVSGFGRDGIFMDGNSPNSTDFSSIKDTHAFGNRRDGFHFNGGDTSVMQILGCNAYQNGRHGFYNAGGTNTYTMLHASGNGALSVSATTSAGITASGSAQTVTLSNVTNIAVGDLISVDTSTNLELVLVTALPGSNQVTGVFSKNHSSGVVVVNGSVDFYEDGTSCVYLNIYAEGGASAWIYLGPNAIYHYFIFGIFGAPNIYAGSLGINGDHVFWDRGHIRTLRLRDRLLTGGGLSVNHLVESGVYYMQAGGIENLMEYNSSNQESVFTKLGYSKVLRATGTPQTLTGAGAVNLTTDTTLIVSTGADALTLADGSSGQIKKIMMKTDGGDATLTPTNRAGYSSIVFNDVGDTVLLQFQDSKWWIIGSYGVTIS